MRRGAVLLQRSAQILVARGACRSSVAVVSMWNPQLQQQTRGIKTMKETKEETVVVLEENEQVPQQSTSNKDDSAQVWEECLKKALQHHKSTSVENNVNDWISSLETVRDCYVNLGYWDDALRMEEQLLDVLTELQDQADCFHRMGSLHLQLQHFDKARIMYQAALEKFYEIHGHDSFHRDMGKLLIGLGGIRVHSGNPEQALPYLAQAEEHYRNHGIRRSDSEQPDPHPELTTVLANQAVVHRMLGQHQVAIEKYKQIKAFVDDDEEKKDELQFQIADCLFTLNQLSPALDHFETLLENEVRRRGGEQSAHQGALRHHIGVIHSKQVRAVV